MNPDVRVIPAEQARTAQEDASREFAGRWAVLTGASLPSELVARWWPLAALPPVQRRDPFATIAARQAWLNGQIR